MGSVLKRIRVLIADDHPLIRAGLRDLLERHADLAVVGDADSFPALWEALEAAEPDVLLLDLRMPGGTGVDAVKRVRRRHPGVQVLILSSYPEKTLLLRMMKAGAAGYLQKDGATARIVEAVRTVAGGGLYISEAGGQTLAHAARSGGANFDPNALSDREFQVLRLLGAGLTPGEIAEQLHVSAKTVSTYRARLMEKMGFSTTADIIRYTLQNDLSE